MTKLLKNQAIDKRDYQKRDAASDLLALLVTRLASFINKTASESLLQNKRQKSQQLPITADIQRINQFILKK